MIDNINFCFTYRYVAVLGGGGGGGWPHPYKKIHPRKILPKMLTLSYKMFYVVTNVVLKYNFCVHRHSRYTV